MFHRKHVKLSATVYNGWEFHIEAPGAEAAAALTQWVNTMRTPPAPAKPPRTVGFNSTPPVNDSE
jgi:hypothetical protein